MTDRDSVNTVGKRMSDTIDRGIILSPWFSLVTVWSIGFLGCHVYALATGKHDTMRYIMNAYIDASIRGLTEGSSLLASFLMYSGQSLLYILNHVSAICVAVLSYIGFTIVTTLTFFGEALSGCIRFTGLVLSSTLNYFGKRTDMNYSTPIAHK